MAYDSTKSLQENFRCHPNAQGIGYITHAIHAACFGLDAIACGGMFLFHALFPFWCESAGSDGLKRMADHFREKDEQTSD